MRIVGVRSDRCAPQGPRRPFILALCLAEITALGGCSGPLHSKTPGAGGTGGASASGGSNGLGGAADAKGAPDSATCDDLASAAQKRLDDYLDSIAAQTLFLVSHIGAVG